MSSEIRDINNKVDHQVSQNWYSLTEVINPSNVNYSTAQIVSVKEDLTTCDILLQDNTYIPSIKSRITVDSLNSMGHLKIGDIVLVKHRGKHRDCEITQKIQSSTLISNTKAIETTGGTFNKGVYLT